MHIKQYIEVSDLIEWYKKYYNVSDDDAKKVIYKFMGHEGYMYLNGRFGCSWINDFYIDNSNITDPILIMQ